MKKFLLGVAVTALLSFTSIQSELITVKPATPKSVVVHSFETYEHSKEVAQYVRSKTKQGYITKTITACNFNSLHYWLVVMEKY